MFESDESDVPLQVGAFSYEHRAQFVFGNKFAAPKNPSLRNSPNQPLLLTQLLMTTGDLT